ncbi:hypothetical protein TEA_018640 [Camellia sinensis var. sinensis]|uniref:Expansin-like EG45 domain-containing protein n=1 Tax=Camellia sinensis var. sinensis TaxID=542762 RepID=A0A4S4EB94_CAMSN|nr:hypothetical protein TEA_018640 [Camellia sinensis var. sinensis]
MFSNMPRTQPILQWLSLFILVELCLPSHGDVGTAAQYDPPYIPDKIDLVTDFRSGFRAATACYGSDPSQFPSSNLFAAVGDGIWDNGASCGRQYLVRCISATAPETCVVDQTVQIRVVDYVPTAASNPSAGGTTIVLSKTAFGAIANSSAALINIEFQQLGHVILELACQISNLFQLPFNYLLDEVNLS